MKTLLLLPLALAIPAFAGSPVISAKQPIPPPDTCATTWFAGASVGYLDQFEAPMYNAHVGLTNTCWNPGGFNIALFAEVGYAEKEWTKNYSRGITEVSRYSLDTEHSVVPITLNVKFEHKIVGGLTGYFGGGLGAAWTRAGMTLNGPNGSSTDSDTDWVFTAQVFAGLGYNVSSMFELYGGARWIYFADPSFAAIVPLSNDWLFELGGRFKF